MRSDPFPFEAVRDLLGVLRALYATTPKEHREIRRKIAGVAGQLRIATEMAQKHDPGTTDFSAAWKRAEEATLHLGDLVAFMARADELVRVAGERVRGRPGW